MTEDICDQRTIADRAGVSVEAVRKWRQRYEDFPAPVIVIGKSPAFNWTDVYDWLVRTGRLDAPNAWSRGTSTATQKARRTLS